MKTLIYGAGPIGQWLALLLERSGTDVILLARNETYRSLAEKGIEIVDGRLVVVGGDADVESWIDSETRVVDLDGRFALPGFIDNHTHFNRAGELLLGINLLEVSDADGLVAEVEATAARLPEGAWMVGGMWGAYEQWAMNSTGTEADATAAGTFRPDRTLIDPVTPDTPALLWNWDRSQYVANGAALEAAGAAGMIEEKDLTTKEGVRDALALETILGKGDIARIWNEYLWDAFARVNDTSARKIVLYLAGHEPEERDRNQIRQDLELELTDEALAVARRSGAPACTHDALLVRALAQCGLGGYEQALDTLAAALLEEVGIPDANSDFPAWILPRRSMSRACRLINSPGP